LRPFDFRESRAFWRIGNIETALWLHAVLGGTPGYRDLVARPPRSVRSFPAWLGRSLLDPAHALFREAEYLLAEEPRLSDKALYHSVLDAVSRGECTPSRIAARLGRSEAAVQHPLRLLEEAGFIIKRADCLRQRRPVYHIADPVIRFHHVVIRPQIAMLEERRVADVWRNVESSFTSQILGPHFEDLARVWTGRYASPATLGGNAGAVGHTVVNDPKGRAQIEIDVLALAQPNARDASSRALVIGEAKASERPRTLADLSRLERARSLLQASGRLQASDARLALFARRGFSSELRTVAANRRDVILVDLERLYEGR